MKCFEYGSVIYKQNRPNIKKRLESRINQSLILKSFWKYNNNYNSVNNNEC